MLNTVKDNRTAMELTQIQLAEMVNVSRQTIISIETGKYVPSVLLSIKIAKALQTTVESLFVLEKGD